jgi:hypothetical protein
MSSLTLRAARRACHHRIGHHQADDLADVLHRVDGKHRLVAGERGQHFVARNIGAVDDVAHAGHGAGCRVVDADEPAMGNVRHHRRGE